MSLSIIETYPGNFRHFKTCVFNYILEPEMDEIKISHLYTVYTLILTIKLEQDSYMYSKFFFVLMNFSIKLNAL